MTPLRILVAADLYYPPTTMGGPITAWRWATRLAARGHHVTVLAPSTSTREAREQDAGTEVRRYPSLPVPHWRADLRRQIRMIPLRGARWVKSALEEVRPDVLHVHFIGPIGGRAITEARRLDIPVLGTNHALPEAALFYYGYKPVKRLQRAAPAIASFLEDRIRRSIVSYYERCDVMTAPSPTACGLYREWGVRRPIVQISNGILLERFSRTAAITPKDAFRARYGIPSGRPLIFYAGRTQPEKRVDVLLGAVKRLAETMDVHLLIAGGADEGTKALARRLGLEARVTFAGYLHPETELPSAYFAADLFASASECEGQGIVFIEAMAAALPVVAADKYAVKDVVLDGETGFLFPVADDAAMARRMSEILSDSAMRARMSERAVQLAAQHDIERSVEALEALMTDMRDRRAPQHALSGGAPP